MGALSATMNPKYHEGFEPLVPGFVEVPFNDLGAVERAVTPRTAAVMIETVQGEGGIHPADDDVPARAAPAVRRPQAAAGTRRDPMRLRTDGPVVRVSARRHHPRYRGPGEGLGGGVPIGAIVAREAVANVLQPGTHGSTFAGNPLICAAATAVITTIQDEGLVARAAATGAYLMSPPA